MLNFLRIEIKYHPFNYFYSKIIGKNFLNIQKKKNKTKYIILCPFSKIDEVFRFRKKKKK